MCILLQLCTARAHTHTPRHTRLAHAHGYTQSADPSTAQPVRASPRKKPGGAIPSLFVYRARSFAQFVFDIQRDRAGSLHTTTTTILRFDSRGSNPGRFLSRDLRDNGRNRWGAANKLILAKLGTDRAEERGSRVRIVPGWFVQVVYKKKFWKETRRCRRGKMLPPRILGLLVILLAVQGECFFFFLFLSSLGTSDRRRVRWPLPWKALEAFATVFFNFLFLLLSIDSKIRS